MAGLMPLQKSITPWKVGPRSRWPWGRGIPGEGSGGCAGGRRTLGPTPARCPFQARELGTRGPPLWDCVRAGPGGGSCAHPGTELTQPLPQAPPQIGPFHQEDFLRSLEHAGPQLACILKGDWLGLYRWVDGRQAQASCCCGCRMPVATPAHGSAPQPLPGVPHRRFFKSPHFDGWYRQRRREMAHRLEALHLEAICEAVRGLGCGGRPSAG